MMEKPTCPYILILTLFKMSASIFNEHFNGLQKPDGSLSSFDLQTLVVIPAITRTVTIKKAKINPEIIIAIFIFGSFSACRSFTVNTG